MGERLGIVVGQKLVDGHELVALGPKLRQGDLERLDRLAAIAAAVVHEHDIPRLHRQQALRNGIGARSPPVLRVHVPADLARDIGLQIPDDLVVEVAARRAEHLRRLAARRVRDGLLAHLHLFDLLFRALARHVHAIAAAGGRMVVGMGADLVPLGRHALDRLHVIGLIGYLLTNGKERRHGVVLLQHVEQLARRGPRAVVEGQRDDLLAVRVRVVLQIDVVGALLHRLLHGFARYLARARLHLGRLAGHVHVDGSLAQLHLARGRLLGGDIIVLGRVGAVVQLNDIALVQLGRAVGHLVAVDRAGKGGTAPLFQNLPIDREQVSRLRRDHALGDHVVQGRAPIHRARHAVDRHVELQRVQIQIHPHADSGQNDHGDDNGDDARLLLALLLVAPHVGIGSHLAIGLGGGNDPRGHLGRIARIAVRRRLVRLGLGLGRLIVMRLIGLRLVKARILRLGGSGRLLAGHNRLLLEGRRLRCRLGLIS